MMASSVVQSAPALSLLLLLSISVWAPPLIGTTTTNGPFTLQAFAADDEVISQEETTVEQPAVALVAEPRGKAHPLSHRFSAILNDDFNLTRVPGPSPASHLPTIKATDAIGRALIQVDRTTFKFSYDVVVAGKPGWRFRRLPAALSKAVRVNSATLSLWVRVAGGGSTFLIVLPGEWRKVGRQSRYSGSIVFKGPGFVPDFVRNPGKYTIALRWPPVRPLDTLYGIAGSAKRGYA